MALYKIHPLKVAEITAPLGVLAMMGDMQTYVTAPVFVFYLEGGSRKILVDAGVAAPGSDGFVHGFPVSGGGEKGIRQALETVGTTPEEIDILVLTHLHFDHCAAVHLFENARIMVQKKEWETAFNPVPVARAVYEQPLFAGLEKMDLVIVDGERQIAEGVSTMLLPGHSQGMQGLSIQTAKGRAVLAGDLAYCNYNINPQLSESADLAGNTFALPPRPDLPFAPPGIHIDLSQWFESMWKTVSQAQSRDLVIPGHEPSLVGQVLG
jgi:glyoxylase-like metal-dependent hydrolase (beta-lactamase superfamily II)